MKKLIFTIFICLMLSGCYDESEPNNIAYVTAVGIDKSIQNTENYDITFQIANPDSISGGSSEGGGDGGDIVQCITVEAPTVYGGIETANHIISKIISLSHIRLFVFSEEIAREGIADITETMSRSEEIRPNVYLAVSLIPAKKYLEEVKPSAEINPAKYYRAKFTKNMFGGVVNCTNNKFYFYQKTDEKNAAVPLAGVAQTDENEVNPENQKAHLNEDAFEYKIKDYIAGQVAISEKNKSEIMGTALFKGDKMVGIMGSTETLLYNIITNEFKEGFITFASSKTDKPITVKVRRTEKTKIAFDKKNETAKIRLYLAGELISLPADYITEQDINYFEKEVIKAFNEGIDKFLSRLQNEFDSDILGIGSFAKCGFLTYDEYANYNWEKKFKNIGFNVDTDFKIVRSGLTVREEIK